MLVQSPKRFILTTCLGLGLCFAPFMALAQKISNFTLDNGLDVVVIEDHRAPIVVQMLWYRAGSADEPAGKSGIAHFLEHLMFKGTEAVPGGEFSKIIEEYGGENNAFTSFDYTAYYQRLAAQHLPMIMEMEADRMRNLKLEGDTVLTEREVVLEERAQRIGNSPDAELYEQMRAAQYQNHRYGVPVIGWEHEISALTQEDALDWYNRYYAPNNATLVIAGDVSPEEVKVLAEKYYGPIEPSDKIGERVRPQEPRQRTERRLKLSDERTADPYIRRTYLAPVRKTNDQRTGAAIEILAELLGGNNHTSVLARALQFDQPLAIFSSASYDGVSVDPENFSLYMVPAPGVSLEEAEAALDQTLAKFLVDGPEPEAIERIKTKLRAAEIYKRDDTMSMAGLYGGALSSGLSLADIETYSDLINDITEQEIMDAAKQVLNPEQAVTGWLTKVEGAPQ